MESVVEMAPNTVLRIVLINNGSNDKTGEKIDKLAEKYTNIIPIHREEPLNYGLSINEGLMHKVDIDPQYMGWAWSDNQITGKSVSELISIVNPSSVKFARAIRSEKDYSMWRKIQSLFYNLIITILFRKRIQDINGCPKIFQAELFPKLDLQSIGWFLDAEMTLKLTKLIKDDETVLLSVKFNEREFGKTKTSWFTAFELLWQIIVFRMVGKRRWMKKHNIKKLKN